MYSLVHATLKHVDQCLGLAKNFNYVIESVSVLETANNLSFIKKHIDVVVYDIMRRYFMERQEDFDSSVSMLTDSKEEYDKARRNIDYFLTKYKDRLTEDLYPEQTELFARKFIGYIDARSAGFDNYLFIVKNQVSQTQSGGHHNDQERCHASNKSGQRCKNKSKFGQYCAIHGKN